MNNQRIARELMSVARELTALGGLRGTDQRIRNATRNLSKGARYAKDDDLKNALEQFYLAKSSVDLLVDQYEDAVYEGG